MRSLSPSVSRPWAIVSTRRTGILAPAVPGLGSHCILTCWRSLTVGGLRGLVFVNSMSDLFHPRVPSEFIRDVFCVMAGTPRHTYQILTKRSQRLAVLGAELDWPPNVWMGVSVETGRYAFRIGHLRTVPAEVRFISAEPLLGPLPDLDLSGIHWLIAGGESGPGARAMEESWVLDLRDQCEAADVAFFFKQWGGLHSKSGGRLLAGEVYDDMPSACPTGGSPAHEHSRSLRPANKPQATT